MNLTYYINKQIKEHPSTGAQDILKQIYQSVFGVEHLLKDTAKSKEYFDQEYLATIPKRKPLYERISNNYIRVNLASWKAKNLPSNALFTLFLLSASFKKDIGNDLFLNTIKQISNSIENNDIDFDNNEWAKYLKTYMENPISAVHHSDIYRNIEKPSYRIISSSLLPLIKFFSRQYKDNLVITIDGRCASGKSTLATYLSMCMGAQIIHMDDFFLPFDLRTKERLNEVGGNIDYARFINEVIPNLKSNKPFTYKVFNCSNGTFSTSKLINNNSSIIVEGSYASHPKFGKYYDYLFFVTTTKSEQLLRIKNRDGKTTLLRFKNEWIPKEEAYFDKFKIIEKADYIIRNN